MKMAAFIASASMAVLTAVSVQLAAAPPAAASSCSALVVVGARGSGEIYSPGTDGMGPEAFAAYYQIWRRVRDARPYGLPYPAVSVLPLSQLGSAYWQSVSYGDAILYRYVATEAAACPYQRIALIGYSQGAEVIGDTLRNLSASQRALIAQIVLFGDPRFNPATGAIDRGDYNPGLQGVFGARTIASLWYSKMRDYCVLHDPVCNYSPANLAGCISGCPHYKYVTSGTAAFAGALAGNAMAALPPLGPTAPPPPRTYRYYVYHTCANGACGLRVHTGPGYTNYATTRVLIDGNPIDIVCQTRGQSVSGLDGSSSNVWDKLVQGDYAADFYIDTPGMSGAFSPPIPQC